MLFQPTSYFNEIVSSSLLIIPGTYSEANWLHLESFLGIGGMFTSVAGVKDRFLNTVCGRILIVSSVLIKARQIFTSPFFPL